MEVKVGIQLASLRLPLKKALLTAARLGAAAVEIDARHELKPRELSQTGLRQLRKMLEELNLQVAAVGFHTRRGYDTLDDLDQRVAATKEALEFAYRLGAPVVVNHVGRVPPEDDSPETDLLRQTLTDIGRHAMRVGALLAAETGSEDPRHLARLIRSLPEGSLAVNLDPANLIVNGFSPREAVDMLGADIRHIHAKDAVRDTAQGRGVEVPLGRGSADFPELLAAMEEHRYRGYFTIERRNALNPVEEIGLAVSYLKNIA